MIDQARCRRFSSSSINSSLQAWLKQQHQARELVIRQKVMAEQDAPFEGTDQGVEEALRQASQESQEEEASEAEQLEGDPDSAEAARLINEWDEEDWDER